MASPGDDLQQSSHDGAKRTNGRLWLNPEVQPPEIEVRLYPSFRHSGQGWEGLKVNRTIAVLAVFPLRFPYFKRAGELG